MADWFSAKINRFSDLEELESREAILTEIKIKLADLNGNQNAEIVRSLDLGKLFRQLTSNEQNYIEQTCDVLTVLSNVSEPGQILWTYTSEIHQLLSHNLPTVKSFALKEILKVASNPSTLPQLIAKIDLLITVTNTIGCEELGVAKHAMDIMKKIGTNSDGLKIMYSGPILRSIAKLLNVNDAVKFRVYEVIIDISNSSREGLEASIGSGFLQSLISLLDSDDILLHLNVLQMLANLASTQEGLHYLEQQGVLQRLADKVATANETQLSNLLIPGLMKFFGNVAVYNPEEIFSKYPIVISALFDVLETDDQILLGVALDTLGNVSAPIRGKYALQDLGEVMPATMKKLADIIQNMPSELRVRGLNNLALILNVNKSEQDNRILSLTRNWFDSLCDEPLKMIVSLCNQPFADIRQAALQVLAVIAAQEWGQEYIASYPGLIELLLDRGIESFKICKEVKFEVVKNLSESIPNIFDAQTMQRLKQFVSEGPFYVDVVTEVALEGAS